MQAWSRRRALIAYASALIMTYRRLLAPQADRQAERLAGCDGHMSALYRRTSLIGSFDAPLRTVPADERLLAPLDHCSVQVEESILVVP